MRVALEQAEAARAKLLELSPAGFEEVEGPGTLDLFAYTDDAGAARIRASFDRVSRVPVEAGWEDRWKEFHHGVRIAELWLGPPWEAPPPDAVAVVLDPGRAFGTGAHETTRLVLELLLEQERRAVLDVGCGSGVLAIAAAKLGFAPVLAIDSDPVAVEATRRNAAANGVSVATERGDALEQELPQVELVLANLSASAVSELGPRLRSSFAITSGYLTAEQPTLPGFRRVTRRELRGWAADLHARH